MAAVLRWTEEDDGAPVQQSAPPSASASAPEGGWPPELERTVWRGADLGGHTGPVVTSGFPALDAELPGGGWPCQALSEILSPQPSVVEWRLVGPALRGVVASDGQIVLVGPPKTPHLPGLSHSGIDDKHLVWIQADAPAERLWCTEQLVKAGTCGALLAWLPQARADQIRRLQVCARSAGGPVFLFRPESAKNEASAAPLRVLASVGVDWELHVRLLKRRGPSHEGVLRLPSIPGGLEAVITPRLQQPSRLLAARQRAPAPEVSAHAVGSASASAWPRRRAAIR